METSSANTDHTLFPFIDISMILLFLSFTCSNIIKSFFSSIWPFPRSPNLEKPQNFDCSTEGTSFNKNEDCLVVICSTDVEKVMGHLGIFLSLESAELNEYSFGSDEFSSLFEEEPSLMELKEAFDVFDVNGDGFIDSYELQRVVCVLGLKEGFEIETCNKMISKFDVNRDGRIDFQEFAKLMEKAFSF